MDSGEQDNCSLLSVSDTQRILESSSSDPFRIPTSAPASVVPTTRSSGISASNFDLYLTSRRYKTVYDFCVLTLRKSFSCPERPKLLLAALQSLLNGCCSAKAFQDLERVKQGGALDQELAFKQPPLALRIAQEYLALLNFEYPDYGVQQIDTFLKPEEIQKVRQAEKWERGQEEERQTQWGRNDELWLQEDSVRRVVEAALSLQGEGVEKAGLDVSEVGLCLEGEEVLVVSEEWLQKPQDYIKNETLIKRFKPEKYIYTHDRRLCLKSGLLPYLHYRLLRVSKFLPLAKLHGCPYAILRSPAEINLPVISIYWPDDSRRKLQVSSFDTIADITRSIKPFLLKGTECRVWVFSHFSLSPAYLSKLGQAQSLAYFPGTVARDTDTVGSLRLGFNGNSLYIEYQKNFKYYYLTETSQDPRCAHCLQSPNTNSFPFTHCSRAKYCSFACAQADRLLHAPFCERRSCWRGLFQSSQARETAARCSGLNNYGAVCYANAVLQGLASFTAVKQLARRVIRQRTWEREGSAEGLQLVRLFSQLIVRLRSASPASTTAKALISTLEGSYPQFRPRELHDSHEFLTCLLAALHETLKKAGPQPLNLPEELKSWQKHWIQFTAEQESDIGKALYGMLQTTVICSCGNRESTYQEFSTLELPLSDYIPTEKVEIRYFPTDSQPILVQIATQREIRVSDLAASISDTGQAESVALAYQRGTDLVILSPETVLVNYIAAKVPLLAYARPKDSTAQLYEVRFTVNDKEVALPRVGFVQERMTLADVHKAVFRSLQVYYSKREDFTSPKRDNSYDLYYQHSDPKVLCQLCGSNTEKGCPLPYTGAEAKGFLWQFGPVVKLDVRWNPQQHRVDLNRVDEEKQVHVRKVMNCVSLSTCLDTMLAEEKLDAKNCWKCPACAKQVEACLHLSIVHAPNALILHIKRFNASGITLRKLVDKVDFPIDLVLNLKPDQAEMSTKKTYSLCSVIIHQGASLESGHFCAVSRVGSRWMLLDDSKVTEVSEEDVLQMEAYLLFYECVEGQES